MKLRLKFEEVALKNKCEIIEGDNSIFAGYTERADDKFEIELLFVGDNLNINEYVKVDDSYNFLDYNYDLISWLCERA
jgi:hypothetical protein